ncbi:hypothetical protein F5Y09DRAFT_273608 [Xylaria sp. FL1042]|nr:hypothetical protein F5Y09DRAFT_273608 [Xylaria sp. FL1042]
MSKLAWGTITLCMRLLLSMNPPQSTMPFSGSPKIREQLLLLFFSLPLFFLVGNLLAHVFFSSLQSGRFCKREKCWWTVEFVKLKSDFF